MNTSLAAWGAVALLVPFSGWAHHSPAGRYDTASIMEVEGEITAVHWRSPHVEFTLDAVDATRGHVTWKLEAAAPSTLVRSGLSLDTIAVGDQVRAAGWPPATDRAEMFLQNVLLPSGEELLLWVTAPSRWSDQQANDFAFWRRTEGDPSRPELGILRVWSSSLALAPLFRLSGADVDDYPLTAEGRAGVRRFALEGGNPAIRGCVPKGMPLIMEQPYPMEFRMDGDDLVLHMEEYDVRRRIHMDREEPWAGVEPSPLGHSVGRWERDTLVVVTTRLDWPWLTQSGVPLSEEAILVERFTPVADGARLDYELTVTDPVNFTEPVVRGKQWLYFPDQEVRPYECQSSPEE